MRPNRIAPSAAIALTLLLSACLGTKARGHSFRLFAASLPTIGKHLERGLERSPNEQTTARVRAAFMVMAKAIETEDLPLLRTVQAGELETYALQGTLVRQDATEIGPGVRKVLDVEIDRFFKLLRTVKAQ